MEAVHQHDDLTLDTGRVQARSVINTRREQQDALLVTDWVAAVADGMGGHANGAEASRVALAALDAAVDGHCDTARLAAGCAAANDAVRALADGTFRNPGSTLVAVARDGNTVHGAWCGDSRAYLVAADGTVSALTTDHSVPFGGLWACLGDHGLDAQFGVSTFEVPTGVGAKVLLSTDGVHGPLDGAYGIAELLAAGLDALVAAAAAEGSDNATAVLVDVDAWVAAAPCAGGDG